MKKEIKNLGHSYHICFKLYFSFLLLNIYFNGISLALKEDESLGRIPEFDEVIKQYGEHITKGTRMDKLETHLRIQERGVRNPDMGMVEYYYEVCQGIGKEGDAFIVSERKRFMTILDTFVDESEHEYAYKRKNVLEAFIDAAAEAVMRQFDMHDAISVTSEQLKGLNLPDIDIDMLDLPGDKPMKQENKAKEFVINTDKLKHKMKSGDKNIKLNLEDFTVESNDKSQEKKHFHDEM